MTEVYDDNFGFWTVDTPEEQAFFDHVQRLSVRISCERCDNPVRLMPPRTMCARCLSALEFGAPASISQYGRGRPDVG